MQFELTIVYEPGENGCWVASILEIAGTHSQGKTIEEARENVLDAMWELMLARRELKEVEFTDEINLIREVVTFEL